MRTKGEDDQEELGLKSKSMIWDLPPEILASILCKLSAAHLNSILRFVCRSWDSLIRSAHFIQQHLNTQSIKKNPCIISLSRIVRLPESGYSIYLSVAGVHHEFDLSELLLGSKKPQPEYSMSNSCHGLTCLYDSAAVYVMNPIIRRLRKLPEGSVHAGRFDLPLIAIGFDSKRSVYKVVRISRCLNEGSWSTFDAFDDGSSQYYEGRSSMRCEVYMLGGCSWKLIGNAPIPIGLEGTVRQYPVIVNGAVHWRYCYRHGILGPKVAVSFSLRDETFDVIHHPKGHLGAEVAYTDVVKLWGCLCVCDVEVSWQDIRVPQEHMTIWMLKDYEGRKWVKQHIINLTQMQNFHPHPFGVRPVIITDGKIVFSDFRKTMYYYDIESEALVDEKPLILIANVIFLASEV